MIIAANLKTNLTRKETESYIIYVEKFLEATKSENEVIVFPATSSLLTHEGQVIIGAQNVYPVQNGAFTGEIGLVHVEEFGIKTILIGHSERRHILGESQENITKKFNYFKDQGFKIVYCVGEPLSIREEGEEKLLSYIDAQFEGIDLEYEKLIIAYEPVWAIGTGLTPTMDEISSLHLKLKEQTTKPILYGGSVKVDSVKEILNLKGVDGVLVGSAALKVDDFCFMIDSTN